MSFSYSEIVRRVCTDPIEFLAECDAQYASRVEAAAEYAAGRREACPVILLSGPSASGKTTTAHLLTDALLRRGIRSHTGSMDDYFLSGGPKIAPKTPEGAPDLESPLCLDMELLSAHFLALSRGEEVAVPEFDFTTQTRKPGPGRPLRLGKDEIAIFEGIHAMNPEIFAGASATRIFVEASEEVLRGNRVLLTAVENRFLRRAIRDRRFRNASGTETAAMWATVLRGETNYIQPYKHLADVHIESAMASELPVLRSAANPVLMDEGMPVWARHYADILEEFPNIPESMVADDSLLREFIGPRVK